ncbi:PepSY domain-containing protein [Mucilaginibacter koreensis]
MEQTKSSTIENKPKSSAWVKRFYKWHRILGLVALVPVMMWTLSGTLHPLMSNWLRPSIPNEVFKPKSLAQLKSDLTLQRVLEVNGISSIRNFGLVNFNQHTYYQILLPDSTYQYYNADNARILPDGDRQYAIYLARYFAGDQTSKLANVTLQTQFDDVYQPINRLLPVWKISFLRHDGMDVYIETAQSRMGTFNNNTRKSFLSLFKQLHTWGFLAAWGEPLRIGVLLVLVGAMIFTLISGLVIYGLLWNRFKAITAKRKQEGTPDRRFTHRFHRQLGLIVSLVMLTFTTSAFFHLMVKLHNYQEDGNHYAQTISVNHLKFSNLNLPVADSMISRMALATVNQKNYYQITTKSKQTLYFDTQTGTELANGDRLYAVWLANYYRNTPNATPQNITLTKQFTTEYGFINKRLPVEKVSYPQHEDWYIETSSAKLATKVAGIDRAEGFSFIFLHKYFGMTWAGKDVRDIVSMLTAFGIFMASVFGFAAFLKSKT